MLAILIDPQKLDDLGLFAPEVGEYIGYVRASSPARGVDRVLIPGDKERARIGPPLSVTVSEAIFGLAETLNIPVDRAALRAETACGDINEGVKAMAKVLVLDPVHEAGLDRLRAAPGIDPVYLPEPDETSICTHLGDADAVILRARRLPESAFRSAGRLRLVSRHGVGCDNLDFGVMAACGITVAITANANFISVAEHAFALMLAACKRIPQGDAAVRASRWGVRDALGAREIMGARLLVIGFGRTGSALAERARAFGAQILAHDPMLPPDTHLPEGYRRIGRLEEGLSQADIVSLHLPATPRTRHLIGTPELALMPTGSILINTARGGIVDEKALPPALAALRPALYASDVLDREPPAPDDPLLRHDQVILTPHSAAMTTEGVMRMSDHAAQNVLDFLSGRLRPEMVAFAP